MAGLGDRVLNLAKLRPAGARLMAGEGAPGRLTLVTPSGSNPGNLRMWTYAPAGLPEGAPLVVVLHGCTQDATSYDHGSGWSTLADRHGFALLFPEQDRANNPNLCFNWFQPEDVARGGGEVLSIRQMIGQMIALHSLSPHRVYITGLSAGGAMTAAMLATYPELFAGGAIIAGLPYGAADGMQQAFEAMFSVRQRSGAEWGNLVRAASAHSGPWPHVQVWHGEADATVREGNARELIKQWADVHGVREGAFEDRVDGAVHKAWRGPAGNIVLESYLIPGLAHGTPLNTVADDMDQSMGFVAPHMLEAGISSTWWVARSWGLLTQAARPRPVAEPRSARQPLQLMDQVGEIIEYALRTAGLSPGRS
jgi:poly(hydroxyalkanoate) depolymerase family esterase